MKLLGLHIDAFGRLTDTKISFEDGINEIFYENGYGKSTLVSFIKAMLYGLPDNKRRESDRKRYAPWSGIGFGGSLDIETEKGRYRIVRRFGKKSGDDSFSLVSLETMLPCDDYSENVGLDIFGLDVDSYEKSVYLPQKEVSIEMTSKIGARLSGLLESSNDMAEYDTAAQKLRNRRREYKLEKGTGGMLDRTKDALATC